MLVLYVFWWWLTIVNTPWSLSLVSLKTYCQSQTRVLVSILEYWLDRELLKSFSQSNTQVLDTILEYCPYKEHSKFFTMSQTRVLIWILEYGTHRDNFKRWLKFSILKYSNEYSSIGHTESYQSFYLMNTRVLVLHTWVLDSLNVFILNTCL